MSELELLMVAALQLSALKTIGNILFADKFMDMLLIPQLASDPSKSPVKTDTLPIQKDGDLQVYILIAL